MNVLRDTHRALVPGGRLLDFHPTWPPWARLVVGERELGTLEEPDFPEQLRATEAGMKEAVRRGLFRRTAARKHDVRQHYDNADELMATYGEFVPDDVERRLRATTGGIAVVTRVVFHLYRAL